MMAPNGMQHKHRPSARTLPRAPGPRYRQSSRAPRYRPSAGGGKPRGADTSLPAHPAVHFVSPSINFRSSSALRDAAHPEQSGEGRSAPGGPQVRGTAAPPRARRYLSATPPATRGLRPVLPPGRARPPRFQAAPLRPPPLPRTQRPNGGLRATPLPEPEQSPPPPFWDRRGSELTCMPGTCTATGEWAMAGCGGRAPPAAPSSRPPCCWAAAGPGRTKRRGAASARAALPPSLPARPRPPPTHLAGAAGPGPSCATRAGRGPLAPLCHARRAPRGGPAHAPLPAPEAGTAAARCSPGGGSLRGRGWAQSAMSGPGQEEEDEEEAAAVRRRLLPSQLRPCGAEPPPHGPRRHCPRLRAGRGGAAGRRRGSERGVVRAGTLALLWGPAALSQRCVPLRRLVAVPRPLQALCYRAQYPQAQPQRPYRGVPCANNSVHVLWSFFFFCFIFFCLSHPLLPLWGRPSPGSARAWGGENYIVLGRHFSHSYVSHLSMLHDSCSYTLKFCRLLK